MTRPVANPDDAVDDIDLADDWVDQHGDALKEVLSEMTSVYNEADHRVEMKFAEQAHASDDGSYVAINPYFYQEVDPPVEGPNILRLLDEINSHEMGHYNWSDLAGKKEFGDCYPKYGKIPGHVANILEDEYVDARKMREFYGLRSKRAYRVLLQWHTDGMAPNIAELYEENPVNAFMSALYETAIYGAVKGWEECPDDIKAFVRQVKPVIERIRTQDDKHQRTKLFHVVFQVLARYIPDPDEFDEESFGSGPGKTLSGEAEEGTDRGEMSESMEEMIRAAMQDAIDRGDIDPEELETGEGGIPIYVDPDDLPDDAADESEADAEDADETEADGRDDVFDDLASGDKSDDGLASGGDGEADGVADDADDGSESGVSETEGSESGEASEGGDETDGSGPREPAVTEETDLPYGGGEDDIVGEKGSHHIDDDSGFGDIEEALTERYEVRIDEIDKSDERDRARWARLVKKLTDYDLDVEQRKRERDDRMSRRGRGPSSEKLKARAEQAGVIRELKEGFQELVSRPVPRPARTGTRIDPINVARRAAGDFTETELFEEETIVETGDRCVGLATDISGSMGSSIDDLKIAGAALATATQIIGDEFVWEAFTDQPGCKGCGEYPECRLDLRIVTAPNEEFEWAHVDSFHAARNEPTAAGVRDCYNLMQQTDANQYVMIVITDGMALITEDGEDKRGTNVPVEQARLAVNEIRQQGVDVIGLGIGSMDERKMETTFGGNNYRLTTIDSLAQDIIELYKSQLDTVKLR